MRRAVLLLLGFLAAAEDDWKVAPPKSAPKGKPLDLAARLEGKLVPRARVVLDQTFSGNMGEGKSVVEFDAWIAETGRGEEGPYARARIDLVRLDAKGEDLAGLVRAAAPGLSVLSNLDARGRVTGARVEGASALPALEKIFLAAGSWIVPWLPGKPVRTGEAWQVPSSYFLWTLQQIGIKKAEGAAWQVLEAVEKKEGADCARIRTTFGLRHTLPKSEPVHDLGDGPVDVRVKGKGTEWFGLDGFLRESSLEFEVSYANPATGKSVRVNILRTVKGGPGKAPDPKAVDDWAAFAGDLAFTAGYEEGMAEARFTGRAPMFFYVSRRSAEARAFGAAVFRDAGVKKCVAAYTPVLIDADADKEFAEKVAVAMVPGVYWLGLEGDPIFMAVGASPIDLFREMAGVAEARAPDPEPSPEYLALEKERDALRAALARSDTAAAVGVVLRIRASARGLAIRREAAEADGKLTADGERRLAEADALAKKKKAKEARAILEALQAEYGAHEVGKSASDALAKLPPK